MRAMTRPLPGLIALLCALPVLAQPAVSPERPGLVSGVPQTSIIQPKMLTPLPPAPPDAAPPSSDPRDFEGIWLAEPMKGRRPPTLYGAGKLTPQALKQQQYADEMNRKGTPLVSDAGRCRPMNAIGIGDDPLFPAEIIQSPRQVVILQEEGRGRWVIHLDRGHPRRLEPSYWGDSVGHWDGDTLVVDTLGFNGKEQGTTPSTHVVSRLRRIGNGSQLESKISIEDPQVYLEPMTVTSVSSWHPELQILEFQCEENPEGAKEGLT